MLKNPCMSQPVIGAFHPGGDGMLACAGAAKCWHVGGIIAAAVAMPTVLLPHVLGDRGCGSEGVLAHQALGLQHWRTKWRGRTMSLHNRRAN